MARHGHGVTSTGPTRATFVKPSFVHVNAIKIDLDKATAATLLVDLLEALSFNSLYWCVIR